MISELKEWIRLHFFPCSLCDKRRNYSSQYNHSEHGQNIKKAWARSEKGKELIRLGKIRYLSKPGKREMGRKYARERQRRLRLLKKELESQRSVNEDIN